MKNVHETLQKRKSFRNLNGEILDKNLIQETLKIAQRTATSMNGQQIRVVSVFDKEIIKQLCEINWGQKHILYSGCFLVFVLDFNAIDEATNGKMKVHEDIEGLIMGSVDAGLMAQSVELLFQEQNLGTCMIGGLRNDMKRVKKILNITGTSIPILGMTVGTPRGFDDIFRPRMSFESFYFEEQYNETIVRKEVEKYDLVLAKWWKDNGLEHPSYKDSMLKSYTKYYINNEHQDLIELGFLKRPL